jgi:hypothetical protein
LSFDQLPQGVEDALAKGFLHVGAEHLLSRFIAQDPLLDEIVSCID